MQPTLLLAAIASDASYWERFRNDPNTALNVAELSVVGGILAAAGLTWWLYVQWKRYCERRQYHSPLGLFQELCDAHHLSRRQRLVLKSLLHAQRLNQPASLFLQPELFWPPHVPAALASRQRELVQIHGQIFSRAKDATTTVEGNVP
jgi:hypothetical protein